MWFSLLQTFLTLTFGVVPDQSLAVGYISCGGGDVDLQCWNL